MIRKYDFVDGAPKTESPDQIDPQILEQAAHLVRLLDRNLRSRRIYAQNNPTLLRHQKELSDSLEKFLEENEELTLFVEPYELKIQTSPVYTNENRQESFAFRLFSDGIRSLTFKNGLTEEELMEFISAMATRQSDEIGDSDSVTMFWEQEFEHIHYTVADAVVEETTIENKSVNEKVEELLDPEMGHYQGPTEEPDDDIYQDFKVTLNLVSMGSLFQERCVLNPEELDKIRTDLEDCNRPERLIFDFVDMVLAVLQEESDQAEFDKIMETLGGVLDNNLLHGQLGMARIVMEQVHNFPMQPIELTKTNPDILPHTLKLLWPESRIDLLIMTINQEKIGRAEDLETLISLIDPSRVNHLIQNIHNILDVNRRRLVCQGIARLHKGDIAVFLPMLTSKNVEDIRLGIYILSLLKNEKVIDYLPRLLKHPNQTVRKESIAVLRNFQSPKAMRTLINLLKDPNEDIRIIALRVLGTCGDKNIARTLASELSKKSFNKKSLQERKTYFHTIAKLTGDEFVPYLKGILLTRNWLGKQHLNDLYQCAALALSVVGTPLARETLKDCAQSSNRSVRQLSETALKHMSISSAS